MNNLLFLLIAIIIVIRDNENSDKNNSKCEKRKSGLSKRNISIPTYDGLPITSER